MPRIVELEDEPLDGDDYGGSEGHGYDDEYNASSTADGNSLDGDDEAVGTGSAANGGSSSAAAPVTLPESEYRESLGFLRASRKLALPGAGFDAADDGRVVALAALDRFGLLLVSSATGVCCVSAAMANGSIKAEAVVHVAHPQHLFVLQEYVGLVECCLPSVLSLALATQRVGTSSWYSSSWVCTSRPSCRQLTRQVRRCNGYLRAPCCQSD